MSYDFTASVMGVRAAWRTLEQTAHRIAAGSVNARHEPPPGTGNDPITGRKAEDSAASFLKVDLVEELVKLDQSKIDIKANMRVMSVERELERDVLDILA